MNSRIHIDNRTAAGIDTDAGIDARVADLRGIAGLRGPGLQIEICEHGTAVRLTGRLDAWAAGELRTVLHDQLSDGAGELHIDLSEVEIWDRGGLRVLVGAGRRARGCGRRLVFTGVGEREMRLLQGAHLPRVARLLPQEQRTSPCERVPV